MAAPLSDISRRSHAQQLDTADPLAAYREQFVMADEGLIYLLGNSLGRLPVASAKRVERAVGAEWGERLIRGWNDGWLAAPGRIGDRLGGLIGAAPGQVVVDDSTTVNLYKAMMAALALRPKRTRIITDALNFPTDLYLLEGCVRTLGNRHEIVRLPSADGDTIDQQTLLAAIDERTALVTLSQVVFRSGFLHDAAAITRRAREAGALTLWDMSHSVGVVPAALDDWGVDFAVGCTYKYLNGGPGSPAFLYVNAALPAEARSPVWGWFGHREQFRFDLDYQPSEGIDRFRAGSPAVLSLLALEPSVEMILAAGVEAIREKSLALSGYLIDLYDAKLADAGYQLATPREDHRRGSQISLRHPEAFRIRRAVAEQNQLLIDFREPDTLRLGLAPLYTRFADVRDAVEALAEVVAGKAYLRYSAERDGLT